ncbi:MAG TPA: hypothetical protein VHD36_18930 [Pirellulales bacterium]|nr:hypothetical protein [Pirellulales bacterium]
MAIDPISELTRFQHFLEETLKTGHELSPEEALDLWREANPIVDEFDETVGALRQALSDMQGGDAGRPLAEFDFEFRRRHGLS